MPNDTPKIIIAREAKPWFTSRTIWVNLALLVLATAELKIGLLQGLLPVNFYSLLAFALPVINGALRLITTSAVTLGTAAVPAPGEGVQQ